MNKANNYLLSEGKEEMSLSNYASIAGIKKGETNLIVGKGVFICPYAKGEMVQFMIGLNRAGFKVKRLREPEVIQGYCVTHKFYLTTIMRLRIRAARKLLPSFIRA